MLAMTDDGTRPPRLLSASQENGTTDQTRTEQVWVPYLASVDIGDRYAGHKTLWIKVMQRAIFDWVSYRDSKKVEKKREAVNAERWLFQPNDDLFSLENICLVLDLDIELVRRRAKAMTKADVAKMEHLDRSPASVNIRKSGKPKRPPKRYGFKKTSAE